jgi:hypothetical protein
VADEADPVDSKDQDQESSGLYDRANSILAECRAEASLEDLNIAIHLFRVAIDRRPVSLSLRSTLNNNLAAALVTRFALTNRRRFLCEALSLCIAATHQLYGAPERTAGAGSQFKSRVRC